MIARSPLDFEQYADNLMELRYSHVVHSRKEIWEQIAARVTDSVCFGKVSPDIEGEINRVICQRKFIPGGRILSQAGRPYHQTDNCFCLEAEDTREGWADLLHKTTMMFMSGGGVGCDYSRIRGYGSKLGRSGGVASGPVPLITAVDAIAEAARQGGERRGANYASLRWDHPDVGQFIKMKEDGQSLKHTNISVRFDSLATDEYDTFSEHSSAYPVFLETLKHACQYGDPGFQFDADKQILRNACTEIITADDCDSCCIGSINLSKIESLQELADVTELATLFLLCNTLYTDFPVAKVKVVKEKNRRLGLGLMGVAEWFVQRGLSYGSLQSTGFKGDNFGEWLFTWQSTSQTAASLWSGKLCINQPVAVRAIAPTGTISALGHTTPGIEPIFHTAYQRTYNTLKTQEHADGYVREKIIDPVVVKWMEQGYDVRDIDTAWTLSRTVEGIERRLAFQAFMQQYVDNGISSTVNLPPYQDGIEEKIAPVLLRYLPELRGVTFYPDGRYENQPVVPLDIAEVFTSPHRTVGQYESCKLADGCGA